VDSRGRISGPSLAVAEITWAEPMRRLDIRYAGKERSSVLTSSWKGWGGLFEQRAWKNDTKRAKESSHDESVDWSSFVI